MKLLFRAIWYAFAALVLATALYVVAGRLLAWQVDRLRPLVERQIEQQTGVQVQIDRLQAAWHGFDPVVTLAGLRVRDQTDADTRSASPPPTSTRDAFDALQQDGTGASAVLAAADQLALTRITIRPDVPASLQAGRLIIRELGLGTLSLNLETLDGLRAVLPDQGGASSLAARLRELIAMAPPQLTFDEVRLLSDVGDTDHLPLRLINFVLATHESGLASSAELVVGNSAKPVASMVADLRLNEDRIDSDFHLEWTDGLALQPLNIVLNRAGVALGKVRSKGRLWATMQQDQLTSAQVMLDASLIEWKRVSSAPDRDTPAARTPEALPAFTDLALTLAFERGDAQAWQLQMPELSVRLGRDLLFSGPAEAHRDQVGTQLRFTMLDVGLLRETLVGGGFLSGDSLAALEGYAPEGRMERVHIRWPEPVVEAGKTLVDVGDFQLTANLQDAGAAAYDSAPAARNVTGWLQLSAESGEVVFAGERLFLHFPDLYENGWTFEQGAGVVSWTIHDDAVQVQGRALEVARPEGVAGLLQGAFRLFVPEDAGTPNDFELSLGLTDAHASIVGMLTPDRAGTSEVAAWLRKGLRKGSIRDAGYQFAGLIGAAAPTDAGVSQLFINLRGGELDYAEGWPLLRDFRGRVAMRNGRTSAEVSSGKLGDMTLQHPVAIAILSQPQGDVLQLKARQQISESDIDYWFLQTPLAGQVDLKADRWRMTGAADLNLLLRIPLDEPGESARPVHTELDLAFTKIGLQIDQDRVRCQAGKGTLSYSSDKGPSGKGSIRCAGQTLSFRPWAEKWGSDLAVAGLGLHTRIEATRLIEWAGIDSHPALASGSLPLEASLSIPLDSRPISLGLRSTLDGLAVDLPAPIGKKSAEVTDLTAQIQAKGKDGYALSLEWENRLAGRMELEEGEFRRGILALGVQPDSALPARGLHLQGQFERLDATQWWPILQGIGREGQVEGRPSGDIDDRQDAESVRGERTAAARLQAEAIARARAALPEQIISPAASQGDVAALSAGTAASRPWSAFVPSWLQSAEIDIATLAWQDSSLQRVRVKLVRGSRYLVAHFSDKTHVAGQLRMPLAAGQLPRLDLDHLTLPEGSDDRSSDMRPGEVPELEVSIKSLVMADRNHGAWRWRTRKIAQGVIFENLRGEMAGATIAARLRWVQDAQNGQQTSFLTGGMQGSGFESFYEAWQGESAPLTGSEYAFDTSLVWAGGPVSFEWANVNGQLGFKLKDGTFREAGRSADIFRVFGILNTDSLTRRLKLDFSDLYTSGLAYDQVEADARIREGVVQFTAPLAIQAPSSAFKITGQTSLVDDSLDMEMVVVLPLTKNLPLAALLVGAPQVGGALFLIDKLLGDPLSRLTSATYRVTGTLSDPVIALQEMFENDAGGSP